MTRHQEHLSHSTSDNIFNPLHTCTVVLFLIHVFLQSFFNPARSLNEPRRKGHFQEVMDGGSWWWQLSGIIHVCKGKGGIYTLTTRWSSVARISCANCTFFMVPGHVEYFSKVVWRRLLNFRVKGKVFLKLNVFLKSRLLIQFYSLVWQDNNNEMRSVRSLFPDFHLGLWHSEQLK